VDKVAEFPFHSRQKSGKTEAMDETSKRIRFGEWSVEIPSGWRHEVDHTVLLLRRAEDEGRLEFAVLTTATGAPASDEDLHKFVAGMGLAGMRTLPARHGAFTGLRLYSGSGRDAVEQYWFMRAGNLILVVTFHGEETERGEAGDMVAETVASLCRVEPPDAARPTLQ
jgi:hypothetical protein